MLAVSTHDRKTYFIERKTVKVPKWTEVRKLTSTSHAGVVYTVGDLVYNLLQGEREDAIAKIGEIRDLRDGWNLVYVSWYYSPDEAKEWSCSKMTELPIGCSHLLSTQVQVLMWETANGRVGAFLETPSDEALMKLIGHMSLTRDPNAPAEPTSAQRRQLQTDLEVVSAKRLVDSSTKAVRDRYGSVAAAKRKAQEDPTVKIELGENTRLKKGHGSLFKRKFTSLLEASRKDYLSTLGVAYLENQHTGQEEPAGPCVPTFLFCEREALAKLLFPPPTQKPKSHQQQIEDSC